jgi:hypothetical protein
MRCYIHLLIAVLSFLAVGKTIAQEAFAGAWAGDWSGDGFKGRVYANVSSTGRVSGLVINSSVGDWGNVDGTVERNGAVTFAIDYQRLSTRRVTGTAVMSRQSLKLAMRDTADGKRFASVLKANTFADVQTPPRGTIGVWGGTWKGAGEIGNQQITISSDGQVTGWVHNITYGLRGPIEGRVTPQGDFYGLVRYPRRAADPIIAKFPPAANSLRGGYTQLLAGGVLKATYALTRGPLPDQQSIARLVGTHAGNWASTLYRGTATVTISAEGTLTGTVTNRTLRLSGPITGVVNSDGTFDGVIRYVGQRPLSVAGFFERYGNVTAGQFSDTVSPGRFELRTRGR